MKFDCYITATYEIPDADMRAVVEQLKANWVGENIELFPNDIINTAKSMGIGKLQYDEDDVESDEAPIPESDIPAVAPKRKARR